MHATRAGLSTACFAVAPSVMSPMTKTAINLYLAAFVCFVHAAMVLHAVLPSFSFEELAKLGSWSFAEPSFWGTVLLPLVVSSLCLYYAVTRNLRSNSYAKIYAPLTLLGLAILVIGMPLLGIFLACLFSYELYKGYTASETAS